MLSSGQGAASGCKPNSGQPLGRASFSDTVPQNLRLCSTFKKNMTVWNLEGKGAAAIDWDCEPQSVLKSCYKLKGQAGPSLLWLHFQLEKVSELSPCLSSATAEPPASGSYMGQGSENSRPPGDMPQWWCHRLKPHSATTFRPRTRLTSAVLQVLTVSASSMLD